MVLWFPLTLFYRGHAFICWVLNYFARPFLPYTDAFFVSQLLGYLVVSCQLFAFRGGGILLSDYLPV